MVTRRSFLQALMGLPAIAALPAIGQVVEQLPLVETTEFTIEKARAEGVVEVTRELLNNNPKGHWLYLDEHPLHCTNVVMESRQPLVHYFGGFDLGLPEHSIQVETLYDPHIENVMANGQNSKLVVYFGTYVLIANARIAEYMLEIYPRQPAKQNFKAFLSDVQWHG